MEKVAVTGGNAARNPRELRFAAWAAAALLLGVGSGAWAQEAPQNDVVLAQAHVESPLRVQVQTSSLPRLEATDSGFNAPRVDMTLFPSGQQNGLGAVVGMAGFAPRQGVGVQAFGMQQRPAVDLGLRFSHRVHSQQIDITAWRRMNTEDDALALVQARQPVYGARVEMNLGAGKKSLFAAERGFLGLQLQSGARISVKRKNGGPMIYYRTSF